MRRSAVLAGVALILGACTGAQGITPEALPDLYALADTSTATILGPVAAPRIVVTDDPVAVPSTTTTIPSPATSAIDPPTTTTTTTAPEDLVASAAYEPLPGTVALTFDDGPFDGWTDRILDVLATQGVTATFFVATYRLPRVAHLIPEIVAAGHSVQSHSDHHEDLTTKSPEEIRVELATSIDKLVDAGAPRPTCVRPPYGATNEIVNRVAAELGLEVIGWTLNTLDYYYQDASKVVDTTLTYIEPGDNVLMHDQWAPVLEEALPVVIAELTNRGIGLSAICRTELPTR